MTARKYESEEVVELAKTIYQEKIKHLAEPTDNGKHVVVDVESGDYEIDEDHVAAIGRLRERRPDAVTCSGIVGHAATRNLNSERSGGKAVKKYKTGEVIDLGKEIYKDKIKHLVEPAENGKFIVIDVESGDYEIDEQHIPASDRLRERRPDAVAYAVRVGFDTAYDLISVFIPDVDWSTR